MTQEVVHTDNSRNELETLLRQKHFKKIVLVTGRHFDAFRLLDISSCEWHHIIPAHGLLTIRIAKDAQETFPWQPDAIVAIGGGRILDAAKLIIHGLEQRPYFIALPTTAGSGSEATPFAVAYEEKKKISVQSPALLPDFVLLDPQLLSSLPRDQKAVSGIDALAQSVESIWNVYTTTTSAQNASEALRKSWNWLKPFVDGADEIAASEMLKAAHLSGQAIAETRTTGCHALSYYLTAHHHVPHGQAVGFFLPAFFLYNDQPEKLKSIYENIGVRDAAEAFAAVSELMRSCGLATRFSELGLHVDIEALLDSVNAERFANNPVPFNRSALKDLILKYIV